MLWIVGISLMAAATVHDEAALTMSHSDVYAREIVEVDVRLLQTQLCPGDTVVADVVIRNRWPEPIEFNPFISLKVSGLRPTPAVQDSIREARRLAWIEAGSPPIVRPPCRSGEVSLRIGADPIDRPGDWVRLEPGDSLVVRRTKVVDVRYDLDAVFQAVARFYCTREDCELPRSWPSAKAHSGAAFAEFRRRARSDTSEPN